MTGLTIYLLAILVGLAAGTTSGLLGIGGGVILIPLMTAVLKFDFKQAVTASLIVIIPTALSGVIGHLYRAASSQTPYPHWGLVIVIIVGSIAGAQLGTLLCHWLDVSILKKIFAVLLVITAVKLFIQS
ncbi:MAG: sulfite exporter TauE/SafE family protein [Verrucomicrobia bacterium]|nr:sulfite exporter TauE/SafE family protein [Verrucomicrobiota bacterium]